MNNVSNSKFEKIKDIALVVLFLNTILLLYFFWEDINLSNFKLADLGFEDAPMQRTIYPGDVLVPSYLLAAFGDEEYTVIKDSENILSGENGFIWTIDNFFEASENFAEEISKEQYNEVFKYKSLRAVFEYDVPYDEFSKYFDMKMPNISDLRQIREIGMSDASKNSLFIYDKQNEKYYRITGEEHIDFLEGMFAKIESQEIFYYYNIGAYLGSEINSDVLLPIYKVSGMSAVDTLHELPEDEQQRELIIKEIAKGFFGNSFDFVRKIEESDGKVIYMYGYAEKLLVIDIDGSIEYKDETAQRTVVLSYAEALDRALAFAEEHNAFMEFQGAAPLDIYLKNSVSNPSGRRGYRFEFGFEKDGNPVFLDKGDSLIVEVINGSVRYFYLDRPVVEKTVGDGEEREAFSAINALAKNYEYIGGFLPLPEGDKRTSSISIEEVCENITSMESGYYATDLGLIPCWRVTLRGYDRGIFFDLYTAEPVQ